jgi:hypothetical protein
MSKGCKMRDYQNINQWENEIQDVPNRDVKTSSWKKVEEYRLNKPNL